MTLRAVNDEAYDDAPPQSMEAEQAVLGSMLADRRLVPDAVALLRPQDFYRPGHAVVFEAVADLHARLEPTDPVAVLAALTRTGQASRIGGAPYLHELLAAAVPRASIEHHARIITTAADQRAYGEIGATVRQLAYSRAEPAAIAEYVTSAVSRAPNRGAANADRWSDVDPDVIGMMETGSAHGIPTPWPQMNRKLIGGLVPSRVYVVGGRPGEGKSLIGQALAVGAAHHHQKRTLFVSLEMSRTDLGIRIYANQARVNLSDLFAGRASPTQWDAIARAQQEMTGMPLFISDAPVQTMADIRASARAVPDLALVVIDYLQLVEAADRRAERRIQVDQISRECKLLAKERNIPVVLLAQLARAADGRDPVLKDLRESGAIEQDADAVVLLRLEKDTGELHADVAKNRFGPQGVVELELAGHHARIVQVDGDRE